MLSSTPFVTVPGARSRPWSSCTLTVILVGHEELGGGDEAEPDHDVPPQGEPATSAGAAAAEPPERFPEQERPAALAWPPAPEVHQPGQPVRPRPQGYPGWRRPASACYGQRAEGAPPSPTSALSARASASTVRPSRARFSCCFLAIPEVHRRCAPQSRNCSLRQLQTKQIISRK